MRDRVSILMRDVDVDRVGGDARDKYWDKERDDEEQDDQGNRRGGADLLSGTSAPVAGLRGQLKCPLVVEDELRNRVERVGVERVGRGRNGLGKERGGGMGTICS